MTSFLNYEELNTSRTLDFINILKGTDSHVVESIIEESISVFDTFLGGNYDMANVFSQTGEDRNKTILKYLKKLVVYELMERRKPGGDDKDYQEVMKWLEDIASGRLQANLPPKLTDIDGDGIADESTPFFKLGSRRTYKNHW